MIAQLVTVVVVSVAAFAAVAGAYSGGSGATSLENSVKTFKGKSDAQPQVLPPVTSAELDKSLRVMAAKEGREKRLVERKMSGSDLTRVTIADSSATV